MSQYGLTLPAPPGSVESGPMSRVRTAPKSKGVGSDLPTARRSELLGRIRKIEPGGEERIVSARLNPELVAAIDTAITEEGEPTYADVQKVLAALKIPDPRDPRAAGGSRKYVGGSKEEYIAFIKSTTLLMLYSAGGLLSQGAKTAAPPVKAYVAELFEPLGGAANKLGKIALALADEVVRVPITVALISGAGAGYTANVAAKVIKSFNQWGKGTAEYLLSDRAAEIAAAAAVASTKDIAITTMVGGIALNQLGVLPLSAVLAIILMALKANLGTGPGRAYLVASFYTWYIAQDDPTKLTIQTAAMEYGKAAKTKSVEAATKAAKKLGPLLAAAGGVGKNAFKAVADRIRAEEPENLLVEAVVEEAVPAPEPAPAAESALIQGISVASAAEAAVVSQLEKLGEGEAGDEAPAVPPGASPAAAAAAAAGPEPPKRGRKKVVVAPGAGAGAGGRRKTKKRGPKRRVTRRRKPTKVMGAPVFIY